MPENSALADQHGIVMGSSHCEPMLQNNVWWPHENGPWGYQNRDRIDAYWEKSAQARGQYEAVWTEGIRGIHDAGMQGPPDVPGRVARLAQTIVDERQIIDQHVTHQWGPVAQCFIPYKEVQPLYDAGLEVPPDGRGREGTSRTVERPGGTVCNPGVQTALSSGAGPVNGATTIHEELGEV